MKYTSRMLRRAIPIFLVFLCFPAYAFGQEEIDDVQQLLEAGVSLYQQAQFQEASEKFSQALNLLSSQSDERKEELMSAQLWAGAAAFRLNRYSEAESHYQESLKLAEKENAIDFQSNLYGALANLYSAWQKYDLAGDCYFRLAALYEKSGKEREARGSREYGAYMRSLSGNYGEAVLILDQSLSHLSSDRTHQEVAWLYSVRGMSRYYLKRYEAALEDYQKAVKLLEGLPPSRELAQATGWLGTIRFEMGESYKALQYFDRSVQLAKKVGSPEDELRALGSKGNLFATMKQYKRGALYYEEALVIALRLQNLPLVIASYESLAYIYREARNNERSIRAYEKLIPIYAMRDEKSKVAEAYNRMGLLAYDLNNQRRAQKYYKKSLEIYRDLHRSANVATLLFNLGVSYDRSGQRRKSSEAIEEGLSIQLAGGDEEGVEDSIAMLAEIYRKKEGAGGVIPLFERFIPAYERPGKETELSNLFNNIGNLYDESGDYRKALQYYEKALAVSKKIGHNRNQAIQTYSIARTKVSLSRFDEAARDYAVSLEIARSGKMEDVEGRVLNATGELYRAWGWYEKSLEYYKKAEDLFESKEDQEGLVSVYNNMGQAIRQAGKPTESMEYYRHALALNEKLENPGMKAILLSNMGNALRESGDLDQGLSYYVEALKIDSKIHNTAGVQIRRQNIGLIYHLKGDYSRAVASFQEYLDYVRSNGARREEAIVLTNMARSQFYSGKYDVAASLFEQAIKIHEELRRTATGPVRREYLASQIAVYRDLAFTYFEKGEIWKSIYALELSKARVLLEQMGKVDGATPVTLKGIASFQENLFPDEALLFVATLGGETFQLILIDRNGIASTVSVPDRDKIAGFYSEYGPQIRRVLSDSDVPSFTDIVQFYRYLLSKPVHSRQDHDAFVAISHFFYELWVAPLKDRLASVSSILIIPDGVLGTIPFETLMNDDGSYLVEKYYLSYAPSITVAQKNMKRSYPPQRKSMLALGGALYNSPAGPAKARGAIRAGDADGIRQVADSLLESGESTRSLYSQIGFDQWPNLPGTLEEVEEISRIVPGAELRKGEEVNEGRIKDMSSHGELSRYRVIHFATHGVVIPEVPELSAVVLSLSGASGGDNDGYLTMREISRLKMEADFVNLSACETGLGKIYEGEGIVGLSQAFLVAGAKTLSVSLWQVSDESTMKFMTGLYRMMEEEKIGFAHAMAKMKRKFIQDKRYRQPFYWAPFIFYGDSRTGLEK